MYDRQTSLQPVIYVVTRLKYLVSSISLGEIVSLPEINDAPWVGIWGIEKVNKIARHIESQVLLKTEGLQDPGVCLARKKLQVMCDVF